MGNVLRAGIGDDLVDFLNLLGNIGAIRFVGSLPIIALSLLILQRALAVTGKVIFASTIYAASVGAGLMSQAWLNLNDRSATLVAGFAVPLILSGAVCALIVRRDSDIATNPFGEATAARIANAWESAFDTWDFVWLTRSVYGVGIVAGSLVALGVMALWIPSAWSWGFERVGGSFAQFCLVAGAVLGAIYGWGLVYENMDWRWILHRLISESKRPPREVVGEAYGLQLGCGTIVGGAVGLLVGGLVVVALGTALAVIAALAAFVGALLVGGLTGAIAAVTVRVIISACTFVLVLFFADSPSEQVWWDLT